MESLNTSPDRMTTKHPARNLCVALVLYALACGEFGFLSQLWPA